MSGREKYFFQDYEAGKPQPDGHDVADMVDDGWTWEQILAFIKARVRPWSPAQEEAEPTNRPAAKAPASSTTQARQTEQTKPAPAQAPTPRPEPQGDPAPVVDIKTRKEIKQDFDWRTRLVFKMDGSGIKPGASINWRLFLQHHSDVAGCFGFEEFKRQCVMMRRPPWDDGSGEWKVRPLQDKDYTDAKCWLEAKHMSPGRTDLRDVVIAVCQENRYDMLLDYLNGLQWDGVSRIENFIRDYFGGEDNEYTRAISHNWLVSSVARAFVPGCKVDTMPIAEGIQGLRKSTAMRVLYSPDFYIGDIQDIGTKDAIMGMQTRWCVEIAEMHKFNMADTDGVKRFMTLQEDEFRPPYGRDMVVARRRSIMVGTINPDGNRYLGDQTGGRRFWPFLATKIDLDQIASDRNQLWAEAVALFKAGATWWFENDAESVAAAEQRKRTYYDPWTDILVPFIAGRRDVSLLAVAGQVGIQNKDLDKRIVSRLNRVMAQLGWQSGRVEGKAKNEQMFMNPNRSAIPDLEIKSDMGW